MKVDKGKGDREGEVNEREGEKRRVRRKEEELENK